MAESKGLIKAEEIYHNRDHRVKELKAEGKKIIGFLHLYPVLEMLTALENIGYLNR